MGRDAGWRCLGRPVIVVDRMWFNETNNSRYFIVPGLIVMVMTIIGAFLTAMVIAREWKEERWKRSSSRPCCLESSHQQNCSVLWVGAIGFVLCVLAGQFLFRVPLRGSLVLLCLAATVYLLVALGSDCWCPMGQEPVPRQPVGHDADLPAGDDAVGFPL